MADLSGANLYTVKMKLEVKSESVKRNLYTVKIK